MLPDGEVFRLELTANLSTGGSAVDVTDTVHKANRFMAERIASIVGLDIAGIDVIAPTLEQPVKKVGGAVIEVNAAPGLRMHLAPAEGTPRNVARPDRRHALPARARRTTSASSPSPAPTARRRRSASSPTSWSTPATASG